LRFQTGKSDRSLSLATEFRQIRLKALVICRSSIIGVFLLKVSSGRDGLRGASGPGIP
jgi:hypothetical protein